VWLSRADGQARLALERLIEPPTGLIAELYGPGWRTHAQAVAGRVEPGHLFEWAWLLMRWSLLAGDDGGLAAAVRLIEVGEGSGVDPARGVAIDALDRELRPIERGARLWPQTERLRATLLAARITGEADYWRMAQSAITTIERYLTTPISGMWWDSLDEDGRFVVEPARASSLYHLVGAITELDETIRSLA
ncbi:MAG: AGE family epimerase/isomerase, partial [Caulobacteraceae bacterium]